MCEPLLNMPEEELLRRLPKPDAPGVVANVNRILGVMRRYMPLNRETKLLEVGCGWGCFTVHFARICDVHGIDALPRMLEINPVKQTSVMDATDLQFADGSFDVVFTRNMLHHAGDINRVIGEMARVSRGHVVLVEPNRYNLLNCLMAAAIKNERGILQLSPGTMRAMAARQGLTVKTALAYGLAMAEMTPPALVPLQKLTNFRQPLGIEAMVVAAKQ